MSVSNFMGIEQSLELLDKLRSTVRLFADREERLKSDYRAQASAELKAIQTATERHSAQLAEDLEQAQAAWQSEKDQLQSRLEHCRRRIRQAHQKSLKAALERIEQEEGRGKYQLQRSAMETDRLRATGLATASAKRDEFVQQLNDNRQAFDLLEKAAQKAFRGYGRFRRLLSPTQSWPEPDSSPEEYQMLEELQGLQARTSGQLQQFRHFFFPRLFRRLSIWLLMLFLVLGHAAIAPILHYFKINSISYPEAGVSLLFLLLVTYAVYYFSRHQASPLATAIAADLAKARRLQQIARQKAESRLQQEEDRIQEEFQNANRARDQQWQEVVRKASELRSRLPRQIDEKEHRITGKTEQRHQARQEQIDLSHAERAARLRREAEARQQEMAAAHAARKQQIETRHQALEEALDEEWNRAVQPFSEAIRNAQSAAASLFPDWQHPAWEQWAPPREFKNAAKIGRLDVEVDQWTEGASTDRRLVFQPARFSIPLLLTYPCQGCILYETTRTGNEEVVQSMNNLIFRLLAATPPGKINFTIIDPVGLGQSFAGLMHLADYAESSLSGRIWTQPSQIEERLAELNEHMEKVIQMYLRNEFPTIAEFNAQAGVMAEKYHFLVIAGFPVNFNESAARRLLNIAANGARCGVYTIIHWDQRHALPHGFLPDELRKNGAGVVETDKGFILRGQPPAGVRLHLDAPPPPDFATRFLHQVGRGSIDAARVEVPFAEIAPAETEVWTADTTEEARVPIGRSGATKLQHLALGKGTRQHALIAGKTGSGKSTLFHIIITNLALWCSPEQVEFYLVDFKKGVEFKRYATRRLPHARVVAIESDREFGLSVLQRVDEELRRRGDLFRKLGAQDLPGYRRGGGTEQMPRCLLIIDEFQEFFVEEDRISQNAAMLLDRIVRQGRAFGIHVLLGSQTLGGAYSLARATLGQMVVRIALQCNEADAYLIMDENNAAPRLLSRPGEGIYNDAAGALAGNSPFQTAWLSDEERDACLARIRQQADQKEKTYPGPMIFEGNAPADVQENRELRKALESVPLQAPSLPRVWLGAPNSIKGPTGAVFPRQTRHHLLMVGQREESILALFSTALVSIAAQYPIGAARLILFDSTAPGSPARSYLDRVIQAIPHVIQRPRPGELAEVLSRLAGELEPKTGRPEENATPDTFLLIHGLEHFKKLRQEEDFSLSVDEAGPSANSLLATLISEGPSQGFHLIASCDTYNNVVRFLGRKTLSEIALRLLFQMSPNDSASLMESPEASSLGLHRALLYNDQEGYTEIFRPYALPGNNWLEEVSLNLSRR